MKRSQHLAIGFISLLHFPFFGGGMIHAAQESINYVTENRVWTSSDGKTLTGRLMLFEDGDVGSTVRNGQVKISVGETVYDLPLERLSDADREFILTLKAPDTANTGFPTDAKVDLVSRDESGPTQYQVHQSHVFPSFSEPQVIIQSIAINEPKINSEEVMTTNISLQGNFRSMLARSMGALANGDEIGSVYLNSSDLPAGSFQIIVGSSQGASDFGSYEVILEGAEVTEGNNVIELFLPDPVSKIPGIEKVAFSVEREDGKTSAKIGELNELKLSKLGEAFPYFLAVSQLASGDQEGLRLEIGQRGDARSLQLNKVSESGEMMAMWDDTQRPVAFILLPSRVAADPARIASLKDAFDRHEPSSSILARDEWLMGYSRGVFIHGADLVLSDGTILKKAAELSEDGRRLAMKCRWISEGKSSEDFTINLSPSLRVGSALGAEVASLHDLLWRIAELYREKDSRAKDVTLSLLTGDYDSLGIGSVEISGWRSEFLTLVAEALEDINEKGSELTPTHHGAFVGMLISAASQFTLPPYSQEEVTSVPRILKSELIERMMEVF